MTQTIQPGQHPDAEQLSAFAEHALPPHEQQQLLAHLAACSDCRALVFLAQEAVPAAATLPQPIPAHKPWFSLFSGWKLALPAAVALACLVVVTVHLHNQAMDHRMNAALDKTAHLEQAPPPAPPPPPAQMVAPLKPAPAQAMKPAPIAPPAINGLEAKKSSASAVGGNSEISNLALTGRDTTELLKVVPGEPARAQSAGRQSSFGMVSSAGYASASAAPAAPQPRVSPAPAGDLLSGSITGPLPHAAPGTTAAPLAGLTGATSDQVAANASAATPPRPAASSTPTLHSLNQQYSATPPLPPAQPQAASPAGAGIGGATNSVTETVNVTSAPAALETESNASSTIIRGDSLASLQSDKTLMRKKEAALPSRLPVLATTSNGRQQLALDTAGALFRSEDAGVTWRPVAAQWTGRAVKLSLSPASPGFAKDALADTSASRSATPAAKTAPTPPPLFQLTTDTGQLWTSPDGQTWKRQ
jgi:hypothetical protein